MLWKTFSILVMTSWLGIRKSDEAKSIVVEKSELIKTPFRATNNQCWRLFPRKILHPADAEVEGQTCWTKVGVKLPNFKFAFQVKCGLGSGLRGLI